MPHLEHRRPSSYQKGETDEQQQPLPHNGASGRSTNNKPHDDGINNHDNINTKSKTSRKISVCHFMFVFVVGNKKRISSGIKKRIVNVSRSTVGIETELGSRARQHLRVSSFLLIKIETPSPGNRRWIHVRCRLVFDFFATIICVGWQPRLPEKKETWIEFFFGVCFLGNQLISHEKQTADISVDMKSKCWEHQRTHLLFSGGFCFGAGRDCLSSNLICHVGLVQYLEESLL